MGFARCQMPRHRARFKSGPFRVTLRTLCATALARQFLVAPTSRWSITPEALVAEHLQPVRMRSTCQQLGRTLAHPLCVLAPLKTTMVQKELQQRQVARTQLPPQKEVA